MPQFKDIDPEWVRAHVIDAVHINYQNAPFVIAPLKHVQMKRIDFIAPEAEPLIVEKKNREVADTILDIMLSKSVRRGKREMVAPFMPIIRQKIQDIVDHDQPISFILPTLPFKDQSPFVTGAHIDHTDLGEYAFFAQVKRILAAIQTVYPPGAHMTLLCDGYVYADIFAGGDVDGAGRYKANCEKIKNEYELYNQVTMFDMREVLFDMPEWASVEATIQKVTRELYHSDPAVKERLNILAKRFIFHVALPDTSYEQAREIYTTAAWPLAVTERLLDAAIRYTTLHLTLQKTNVVERAFPAAVRCTVHPKAAAQLPLHLTNPHNQLLPYNGIATVSRAAQARGVSLFQSLRIKRLCDIFEQDQNDTVAVYTGRGEDPFYYEVS